MASCLGFLLAVGVFFQVVRFSGGSAFQVGAFPLEEELQGDFWSGGAAGEKGAFQRRLEDFWGKGAGEYSLERREIHIQRRFSCLRIKFLLLEEYSESGASLGVKVCW